MREIEGVKADVERRRERIGGGREGASEKEVVAYLKSNTQSVFCSFTYQLFWQCQCLLPVCLIGIYLCNCKIMM